MNDEIGYRTPGGGYLIGWKSGGVPLSVGWLEQATITDNVPGR